MQRARPQKQVADELLRMLSGSGLTVHVRCETASLYMDECSEWKAETIARVASEGQGIGNERKRKTYYLRASIGLRDGSLWYCGLC